MTTHDPEQAAQALDSYLHGALPADHPDLPAAEAQLGLALKSAAEEIQPPAQLEAELERSLIREAQRKPSRLQRGLASTGRTAAWAALAIVLLLGLGWVFRTLLPGTAPGAGPTGVASPPAALPTASWTPPATQDAIPEQATPAPSQPASLTTYRLPMLQDVEVALQADLPEAPQEVQVYQQVAWPALTRESALQLAQQLGVDGKLYQAPSGSTEATSFIVSDGYTMLNVQQAVPWFLYRAALGDQAPTSRAQSLEEAQAAAEAFLASHGLESFDHRVETQAEKPGEVLFVQTLDGIPVRYSHFDVSKVRVQVDKAGQVSQVESNLSDFEALGSYPIISAQEAWEKVLSPETVNGLESSVISGFGAARPAWQRVYALDTTVELFGYAQSFPAVDPGQPPLIFFKDYPAGGNIQGLAEAAENNRFVQAWGQFQEDNLGRRKFQIDGWQVAPYPDQSLQGTIERQDGRTYLVTDNQRLLLPDAPDDLPAAKIINANGVVLEEPELTLDWSSLFIGPLGGGGGGGGSGFAELNLYGPPVTPQAPVPPEPTPTPMFTVGKRMEGAEGNVIILINQFDDGSSQLEVMLYIGASPEWPDGLAVRLDGPGLEGIDAYHNLPVRVWGQISDTTGLLATLTTERFEPVYPGVKIQAWLGLIQSVTIDGQQVLQFTTQDGEQFVLKSSLENPGPDELIGEPNDPVVVEGFVLPDQTLGNYPVLADQAIFPMPGTADLSNYEPRSSKPMITIKTGIAGEGRSGVIDRVELVYQTEDPHYQLPSVDAMPLYAQPAWRFSGHYADGTTFVILVQALRPEFLK